MMYLLILFFVGLLAYVVWRRSSAVVLPHDNTVASYTRAVHQKILKELPFDNKKDFDLAQKGFIGKPDRLVIKSKDGTIIWDMEEYAKFQSIDSEAPASVNPSLWRQARLNALCGLYKVTESVYQVRGYDLSVMSIIVGDTGYIVIDPLTSQETAEAAMDLVYKHLSKKSIHAVIYTHSHADHFGGVKGIITLEDVEQKKTKIIAPKGFLEEVISEHVMAGNVMSRRASYMYGTLLPKNEYGHVDNGLGKAVSSGNPTLILPTDTIDDDNNETVVDGVNLVFQYTPNTEAPSEMNLFLPQYKALCMAENATHTQHNLYTLRGAQVRDTKSWVDSLTETIALFGEDTEVVFASHHWPIWSNSEALTFLEKQRDAYKYIHDQTLRLANQGYTMLEIAEIIRLPKELGHAWYNRGYYGTVSHNVKAVYQKYLGWFDGNPAHLHQLPPVESGKKFVEYMGGENAVLQKAHHDFMQGNYRWVAQVLNHLIFANPNNTQAKELQAATFEQLGYQSESGPWRNFYLSGAQELRTGVLKKSSMKTVSPDIINAMSYEMLFDYWAVHLNGPRSEKYALTIDWYFSDTNVHYTTILKNGVLRYKKGAVSNPDVSVSTTRDVFVSVLLGSSTVEKEQEKQAMTVSNTALLVDFFGLFDRFEFWFSIVSP